MNLPKTKHILSFLEPIEFRKKIINNSNLFDVIQENNPKYTVLPKDFFNAVIDNAHDFKLLRGGDWVQLGVWKGGGALFFKSLMDELRINEPLFLYDTYGKIPLEQLKHDKDKKFITDFNLEQISDVSYLQQVKELFNEKKLNNNVSFIEADILSIDVSDISQNIAFLFIDLDFFEPIFHSLELFYNQLITGGILIVDDYYMDSFNCKEAVDSFFKTRGINLEAISERFSSCAIKIIKP